jgi:acyl-CoA synthetase (AMP-forming)/AMP-acid ligase II
VSSSVSDSPRPAWVTLRGPSLGQLEGRDGVSTLLAKQAKDAPDRIAVVDTNGERTTFRELDARTNRIARGLLRLGLRPGDRCSLFVNASVQMVAVVHALFRLGAIPVLIDPGMGRRNLLSCIERSAPRALIGVPRAQAARILFPRSFRSLELNVTVGRRAGWGGTTLAKLEVGQDGSALGTAETTGPGPDDLAAILFTSGSTGPPKGVEYTHGNFAAQLHALAKMYGLEPGEVDVACFPLFALFDNALGMTSVFPRLDPTRMAKAEPAEVARAIEEEGATFTFASPAVWRRFVPWAKERGFRFSKLKRVTIAGAPVAPKMIADLRDLLPVGGEVYTPYGATEALPVAHISGTELSGPLAERAASGAGTCVGRPAPGIELRLIAITDASIASMGEASPVAQGQPGEICVRGPVATRAYADAELATRLAKIADADGGFWHRMGDIGILDAENLLWFQGRRSHRLETRAGLLMPVPIENLFHTVEELQRVALVGIGARGEERPFLILEAAPGVSRSSALQAARAQAARCPSAAPIEGYLTHKSFPVDVRHNAKIHRLELKRWAEAKVQ